MSKLLTWYQICAEMLWWKPSLPHHYWSHWKRLVQCNHTMVLIPYKITAESTFWANQDLLPINNVKMTSIFLFVHFTNTEWGRHEVSMQKSKIENGFGYRFTHYLHADTCFVWGNMCRFSIFFPLYTGAVRKIFPHGWQRHGNGQYHGMEMQGAKASATMVSLPRIIQDLHVNTLKPTRNGHHYQDDIFKPMHEFWLKLHWSIFPEDPINNIPALAQIMAWHQPGNEPLSETMMVRLTTHICLTYNGDSNRILIML